MRFLTIVAVLLAGSATLAEIPNTAEAVQPLLVGAAVPEVTLRAAAGGAFDLRAETTEQRSVVIFYRGGW